MYTYKRKTGWRSAEEVNISTISQHPYADKNETGLLFEQTGGVVWYEDLSVH